MTTPRCLLTVPRHASGTYYGLTIHRHLQPGQWKEALEAVPEALRADAEAYLRDIASRMRAARALTARREAAR